MKDKKLFRKSNKKQRQEWKPHWLLKVLYVLASTAWSLFKIALGAAATVILIALVCAVVFIGTLGDYLQEDILTEAANWSMDDYDLEETSFIYYVDNSGNIQQLQQIYTTTDRQWASLEEIPEALINATIAIEDKRFYEHQGVDWITTVKACVNMFFGGDSQFGGSTITHQLIKNVTGEKSVTVQRKVMEIFRSQMFEKEYDKDTIMENYLNRIYLGKGCYGVKSAAAAYFGKELQSLTVAECASLISITNNPSLFNPYSDNEFTYKGEVRDGAGRNRYRQLNVLNEMLNQGFLSQEEYDEAIAQEMVFKEGIEDQDCWAICENTSCGYQGTVGTFTTDGTNYYCPQCSGLTHVSLDASQYVYSWFVDAVLIDVASDLAELDGRDWETLDKATRDYYLERIQKGGYHIYTTLDMDKQIQVDKIYTDLNNIPTTRSAQQLQSAIVVIDNTTGDVVALSGGVGEKDTFFAYNKATQAKLQTGSAQKPISVYAPAFEKGVASPATVLKDLPFTYDGGAWPKNDNRKYNYSRTIFNGLVYSANTISVRTLELAGYEYAYNFAKFNLGQAHLTEDYPLGDGRSLNDLGPSPLALGALTVGSTVHEMAQAYATFPNNGVFREARLYTKVYNGNGQLILDNVQESKRVLSEKTANYMNYCLYNAANVGTGGAAIFQGQTIAGKTGTTSSNRDRWFCGYTAHYTAAVWCGYNQPEEIHLTGNTANPAARLWRMVMQPIHQGLPSVGLYNGNAFRTVGVCVDSGKLATAACQADVRGSRVQYVNVYPEDVPTGSCDKHVQVEYCVSGGGVATDYCFMYPDADVQTRSLVRLTQAEVNEIRSAFAVGLSDPYRNDGYVYFVSAGGEALSWYGFNGDANYGFDAPYLICPLHNEEYFGDDFDDEFGDSDWEDDYDYPGYDGGHDNDYSGGGTGGWN